MNSIKEYFSNPLVGVIGTIASVIGILIGVYFYYASVKQPFFTYQVKPTRTAIVKSTDTNGFKISYDNKPIEGDISAAQIGIWNAGRQAIKPEHILNQIQVVVEGAPIIEARILKTTRSVNSFTLDKSNLDKGILGVAWKILEEKDGGLIQIVYNGDSDIKIKMAGDIEGQKYINQSPTNTFFGSPNVFRWSALLICFIGLVLIAIYLTKVFFDIREYEPSQNNRIINSPSTLQRKVQTLILLVMLILSAIVAAGGVLFSYYAANKPPFDFL